MNLVPGLILWSLAVPGLAWADERPAPRNPPASVVCRVGSHPGASLFISRAAGPSSSRSGVDDAGMSLDDGDDDFFEGRATSLLELRPLWVPALSVPISTCSRTRRGSECSRARPLALRC